MATLHKLSWPRRPRLLALLVPALLLLNLATTPASPLAASSTAAPADGFKLYFPIIKVPLPPQPVNLVNGSFEDQNWFTDYAHNGNQHPTGWDFYSPDVGQTMPFPTKMQQGNIVPAISGGQGEYVHKFQSQLPPDEYLGAPRGLILDGQLTYKAFKFGTPQALRLSQVLTGIPGALMQVTVYMLGESPDHPSPPNTKLEDDHFVASVQLGSAADTRFYATMIQQNDVPGNERHWNKFVVSASVPDDGHLLLQVMEQQNWSGETDFFMDNFSAIQWPGN